ncbi:FliH/SctL family protein [Parachitinimonas caeni]|uniref:Flagellar assembly protein FliH/Type III secretion system HrpE domain-containing protein n=1 Tax=Parachitinimonas caeni TaxID=3031301 RepID=A0ABT7E257_9NEIS|nr:hypothetical protein [Parachitinimonas caeni]MDK2126386.1 hypothetical protein [Parachitinimonas caeni]
MSSLIKTAEVAEQKKLLLPRRKRAVPAGAPAAADPATPPLATALPDTQTLIDQVRAEIMQQFQAEAVAARELGLRRGLREGREAGYREAQQHFARELEAVRQLAGQLAASVEQGLSGLQWRAYQIALESLQEVLGETSLPAGQLAAVVASKTQGNLQQVPIELGINPADFARLRQTEGVGDLLPARPDLYWRQDGNVPSGQVAAQDADADALWQLDRR